MNEIITSPNNSTIKFAKSLHKKKYRDEHGLYFVEGLKMVREALNQERSIHMLIYSQDFYLEELGLKEGSHDFPIYCVASNLFRHISDVKSPQGIIGILAKTPKDIDYILKQDSGLWVILDRIQDPGNMGTIIRTIDAAGGDGVVLLKGCVDAYNPKTIRSTMGSIFRVPIIEVEDSQDFFLRLKEKKVSVLASAMDGENIFDWQGQKASGIKALVIGNESKGISDQVRKMGTSVVSIPIVGGAESLNASVAAGIMIYEILRKDGKVGQGISCICDRDML